MQSGQDKELIHRLQENLERIRGAAGWTAQRLADEIGVSRQTISSIENGRSVMTKTQYLAIRTVLNFEIAEKGNDTLAVALSQYVDAPACVLPVDANVDEGKTESGSKASAEIANSPKDSKTSAIKGLSMLTVALSPVLAGAVAGIAIADKATGKTLSKVFRDFIEVATKSHSSRK